MLFTVKKSLAELLRHLVSHPSDEAALSAVCVALRDGGQVEELVGLLELSADAEQGDRGAEQFIADLSFRIAQWASVAHARELCRTALDLWPVHVAALSLFEQLADASWADELCARYQIFLEDAPSHGLSPDVCEAVTNKLVEASRKAAPKHDEVDVVHQESLCDAMKRAFARALSEVDSVAGHALDVLSLQA